ncbi:MAG: hypothetical protein JSU72_00885 [Deltaproteobacteria bacterium]|nr:MAG: hypothetical protein JSU72_00885 [Deltaproteobacteria bacterium]
MKILVGLLCLTVLAFGYALLAPATIYLTVGFDKRLFGFVGVKLFPFEYRFTRRKKQKPSKSEKVEPGSEKSDLKRTVKPTGPAYVLVKLIVWEFEAFRQIAAAILRLVLGIVAATSQYYLRITMVGGIEAPDVTGQLYGAITWLQRFPATSVSIVYRPDYLADTLRGEVIGGAVVRPYRILREILLFGWRLPKMKTIHIYRKYKKEVRHG